MISILDLFELQLGTISYHIGTIPYHTMAVMWCHFTNICGRCRCIPVIIPVHVASESESESKNLCEHRHRSILEVHINVFLEWIECMNPRDVTWRVLTYILNSRYVCSLTLYYITVQYSILYDVCCMLYAVCCMLYDVWSLLLILTIFIITLWCISCHLSWSWSWSWYQSKSVENITLHFKR